jgi:N-acetylneuraminate lyase
VGAFICGTIGEGMSLTVDERRRLAERWVTAAVAGLRVIVHVGHNALAVCRALAAGPIQEAANS